MHTRPGGLLGHCLYWGPLKVLFPSLLPAGRTPACGRSGQQLEKANNTRATSLVQKRQLSGLAGPMGVDRVLSIPYPPLPVVRACRVPVQRRKRETNRLSHGCGESPSLCKPPVPSSPIPAVRTMARLAMTSLSRALILGAPTARMCSCLFDCISFCCQRPGSLQPGPTVSTVARNQRRSRIHIQHCSRDRAGAFLPRMRNNGSAVMHTRGVALGHDLFQTGSCGKSVVWSWGRSMRAAPGIGSRGSAPPARLDFSLVLSRRTKTIGETSWSVKGEIPWFQVPPMGVPSALNAAYGTVSG